MDLIDLVNELMELNDVNLAQRVIDDSDVQWCLSELHDILEVDAARGLLSGVAVQKRGRWIEWYPGDIALIMTGEEMLYECSVCTAKFVDKSNYCPGCGAKMDGGG